MKSSLQSLGNQLQTIENYLQKFEEKYKKCCMYKSPRKKVEPNISPRFRFEPGRNGDIGNFVPSIACLKQIKPDECVIILFL